MNKLIFNVAIILCSVCSNNALNAQGQHQNANIYAFWKWDGNSYFNIDQKIQIHQLAPGTYWALTFGFTDSDQGGYIGIQSPTGSNDGILIYSLWDAIGAVKGDAGCDCLAFGGEGNGLSCRKSIKINLDHTYRLRVWKIAEDKTGYSWGAWILDGESGVEHYLGSIKVAHGSSLSDQLSNFVEYYGPQRDCDDVPVSIATFYSPTANNNKDGTWQFSSTYDHYTIASCVRGQVTASADRARIIQGGK